MSFGFFDEIFSRVKFYRDEIEWFRVWFIVERWFGVG